MSSSNISNLLSLNRDYVDLLKVTIPLVNKLSDPGDKERCQLWLKKFSGCGRNETFVRNQYLLLMCLQLGNGTALGYPFSANPTAGKLKPLALQFACDDGAGTESMRSESDDKVKDEDNSQDSDTTCTARTTTSCPPKRVSLILPEDASRSQSSPSLLTTTTDLREDQSTKKRPSSKSLLGCGWMRGMLCSCGGGKSTKPIPDSAIVHDENENVIYLPTPGSVPAGGQALAPDIIASSGGIPAVPLEGIQIAAKILTSQPSRLSQLSHQSPAPMATRKDSCPQLTGIDISSDIAMDLTMKRLMDSVQYRMEFLSSFQETNEELLRKYQDVTRRIERKQKRWIEWMSAVQDTFINYYDYAPEWRKCSKKFISKENASVQTCPVDDSHSFSASVLGIVREMQGDINCDNEKCQELTRKVKEFHDTILMPNLNRCEDVD